ncbi:MAG: TetR/AcrR family transcriptional regulator [Acidimicrobiales bacterium]
MTRDRILDAAALEIERNGLTQFRVKRVAAEAGISVALLYSYFVDREDLLAATIVHRFRQVLLGQADIFTTPLRHVETVAELHAALHQMIVDAQAPELDRARLLRIESMSFAEHNLAASSGIAEAKREASDQILMWVVPLEDKGLLATGMTGVAFARIWYALFFGQIALEGEHALSIGNEEWVAALQNLADAVVRSAEAVPVD